MQPLDLGLAQYALGQMGEAYKKGLNKNLTMADRQRLAQTLQTFSSHCKGIGAPQALKHSFSDENDFVAFRPTSDAFQAAHKTLRPYHLRIARNAPQALAGITSETRRKISRYVTAQGWGFVDDVLIPMIAGQKLAPGALGASARNRTPGIETAVFRPDRDGARIVRVQSTNPCDIDPYSGQPFDPAGCQQQQ